MKRELNARYLRPPSRWRIAGRSSSLQAMEVAERTQLGMITAPRPDPRDQRLFLTLLGGWSASLQSDSAFPLAGRKPQALLAYLALHADQPQTRAKLMTLLWGDQNEQLAGQSLRRALYLIRRALGARANHVLRADGDTVALSAAHLHVDAAEFERLVAEGSPGNLERAVMLYRGELLDGLDVRSAGFEDWLQGQRERLYELAVESLAKVLAHRLHAGRYESALHAAQRLLALDPAQEPVHRTLMRLYHRLGRRAAALRQYQACVDVLQRELRAEPEAETTELYLAILQGRGADIGILGTEPIREPMMRRPALASGAGEVPLVGRVPEMHELLENLDRVADGDGRLILVTGEAGIGKSRLVAALRGEAEQRGFKVLLGHSYQTEQVLPFRPFIDALRADGSLRDEKILANLSPGHRANLARLFPELGEPPSAPVMSTEAHAQIFEVLAELLKRLTAQQPVLIALEDIHWADEMTIRLVAFLTRRLAGLAALVAVTFRQEEVEDAPELGVMLAEIEREPMVVRLALDALSRAETRDLVRALNPGDEPRAAARAARVWQASAGIPFVIVETVRELQERGDPHGETLPVVPPPVRVRQLIEARLAHLADSARQVMEVAAVAGEPADFELLVTAAGMSEADTAHAVERLIRRRILQTVGERFEFCHEWVRAIAYDAVLPGLRRALHRAIAEALEGQLGGAPQDMDDRLAHHFIQARLADRAITCLMRVAQTARRRNALTSALRPLDQALALVDQLPAPERERCRLGLTVQKGFMLSMLKRYAELFDLLAPQRDRVNALADPAVAAPFSFLLGVSYMARGEIGRVVELARHAIDQGARCQDRSALGMSHFLFAWATFYLGRDFADGAAHCRRAAELLAAPADAHYRGWSFYFLAQHLYCLGALGPALEAAAQPEAIAEACGAPQLRSIGSIRGMLLAAVGHAEQGVRECERSVALAVDAFTRTVALGWLGFAHLEAGDANRAVPILNEAIDGYHRVGLSAAKARLLGLLADAHLLKGDGDQARAAARLALSQVQDIGPTWNRAWTERVFGRAAHAAGDFAPAERHLRAALEQFEALGARFEVARTWVHLAELLGADGRLEEGRRALASARDGFSSLALPIWEARVAELTWQSTPAP
jgi:DNA-binding SARP family transcriptional activator